MSSENHIAVHEAFRLGPWRVDPGLCEISSGAETIHVEPRAMAVLCHLAAHAQQTVTRDELLDSIWKTRYVVEDALTRCISQLRQHLGDEPRNSRFIQTVPKVGYRLLVVPKMLEPPPGTPDAVAAELPGEAESAAPAAPAAPAAQVAPARRRHSVIVALALVALLGLALWWWPDPPTSGPIAPRNRSVAILPFVVLGDSPDARAFADGMTEDLIQLLATVPNIHVASRTSSYYFKDKQVDIATISRTLGVAHVLEGSVRLEGERILVKAQLIDAMTDRHLWSQEFDRELHDLFEVQREITMAVARRLNHSVTNDMFERKPAIQNMGAYLLLVEGRLALEKFEESAMKNSIAMLEAAVKLDPGFGGAWSQLAVARWVSPASTPMTPQEILLSDEAARAAARRALALDDSSPNAQFVLADSARVEYAFVEAEARYRQALVRAPGSISLQVGYGNLLGDVGRVRDSLAQRQTNFRLDPLSPISAFFLARAEVLAGDLAEARQQLRRARELGFRSPALNHAEAYLDIRERKLAAARTLWSRSDTPEARAMLQVLEALENRAQRTQALTMIRDLPPWNVLPFRGRLYAALLLGEIEIAWQAAEEGAAQKLEPTDAWWLPEASALRKDRRFTALAERMNLVAYWRQYGWPDACSNSDTTLRCE